VGVTTLLGDSFSRDSHGGDGKELNYTVSSKSGNGTAQIITSPLNDGNDVLQLSCLQPGDYVSVERNLSVADVLKVEFQFLFDTDGKIVMKLGDKNIAEIDCPASGPGSINSNIFGDFSQHFSLADLGLSAEEVYSFKIELSAPGDPTCYLDNLVVSEVPEPSTLTILGISAFGLFAWTWRRSRKTV
jgi:hypothetical protein